MPKIVSVTSKEVSVGLDDGTLISVNKSNISFQPSIGDVVEVFGSKGEYAISPLTSMSTNKERANKRVKLFTAILCMLVIVYFFPFFRPISELASLLSGNSIRTVGGIPVFGFGFRFPFDSLPTFIELGSLSSTVYYIISEFLSLVTFIIAILTLVYNRTRKSKQ